MREELKHISWQGPTYVIFLNRQRHHRGGARAEGQEINKVVGGSLFGDRECWNQIVLKSIKKGDRNISVWTKSRVGTANGELLSPDEARPCSRALPLPLLQTFPKRPDFKAKTRTMENRTDRSELNEQEQETTDVAAAPSAFTLRCRTSKQPTAHPSQMNPCA